MNENLFKKLRIPPKYWKFNPEFIKRLPHWPEVKKYRDNLSEHLSNGKGLILAGDYSTGKSSIAAAMLVAALEYKQIGLWVRMDELPEIRIKDPIYDVMQDISLFDFAESCPLLVIDDLFYRTDQKFTEELCEVLIRRRIDAMKTTIITTNRSYQDLDRHMPSLGSALPGNFVMIKVSGYNFRIDPNGVLK